MELLKVKKESRRNLFGFVYTYLYAYNKIIKPKTLLKIALTRRCLKVVI